MSLIVKLLYFFKDGFGIKLPTKVDMPLNKEALNMFFYKDGFGIKDITMVDMLLNKEALDC